MAVNALSGCCRDVKLWNVQQFTKTTAYNHEWSHPADIVAKGSFASPDSWDEDKQKDTIIDDIGVDIGDRNTMVCLIEGLDTNLMVSKDECKNQCKNPESKEDVFDGISKTLFWQSGCQKRTTFRQATCRTEITAEASAQNGRSNEHDTKKNKASAYDVLGKCL